MGLLLRHKLSGQAAAKAEQWRFCARCSAPGEWSRPEGRGSDGESRRPGAEAVRGGDPQPLGHGKRGPRDASRGGLVESRGVRGEGRVGMEPALGVGAGSRGPEEGAEGRTPNEGRGEELSPPAQRPLPFENKSHLPPVKRCSFPGQTLGTRPSAPLPSGSATSAGAFRSRPGRPLSASAGRRRQPRGSRPGPGSTRLRHPPQARLRPRPAAASPSALIKTCEMERLARAAPFYLQHLSCC